MTPDQPDPGDGTAALIVRMLRRLDYIEATYSELAAAVSALSKRIADDPTSVRPRARDEPPPHRDLCARCGGHGHTKRQCLL